jgi:UDP-N-acetylglucosamine--N-acetylmuramyl-(pentapeptide) pyrophosphoryl-undecaprenol N-acetylglucosamine transferase
MKSIVLCGGGTAGHVIPALALLPKLKRHFGTIAYIGEKGGIEEKLAREKGLPFHLVTCAKLKRSLSPSNLKIPFLLVKGVRDARKALEKLRPAAVFSKGGYVALPVVLAAYSLKIPVVAHESDLTPGVSNRISSRFCRCVCASFEECAGRFKNGVYTGSPVREELKKGVRRRFSGFDENKPNLLIMGGSSGARFLNDILRQCLGQLLARYNVIHLAGAGNLISHAAPNYLQIEFLEDVADIYASADLVVCRAGANTLLEMLALQKPMLLIPLPKSGSSRGDQQQNAAYFAGRGYALMADQRELGREEFIKKIEHLQKAAGTLRENMKKARLKDGNTEVVKQILKYSL